MERKRRIPRQKNELQQVNQVRDRLFSIISHDLKSPLGSLRYYLKLPGGYQLTAAGIPRSAEELLHHLRHTRAMIDKLLYWASTQMKG